MQARPLLTNKLRFQLQSAARMRRLANRIRTATSIKTAMLGASVLVLLFIFNGHFPAPLSLADLSISDFRIYYEHQKPTGKVVIASIDDKSIVELGHWPWPRSVLAQLEYALMDYGASVVYFDPIFSEPDGADAQLGAIARRLKARGIRRNDIDDALGSSNDNAFSKAIAHQGETILAYGFGGHYWGSAGPAAAPVGYSTTFLTPEPLQYNMVMQPGDSTPVWLAHSYLPPIPELNRAARGAAFADFEPDADGVTRSQLTVVKMQGRYCVPVFLAVADEFLHRPPLKLVSSDSGADQVSIGDLDIPVDEMGRMMMRFRGRAGTFPSYSVADILAHRLAPSALGGKVVMVGLTGGALGFRLVTPVGRAFPGIEFQATAVDNVLRGDFIRRSSGEEEAVAALLLGIAVTVAASLMSALASLAVTIALAALYLSYAAYRLHSASTLIGVAFPLAAAAITYTALASYRYVTEGREKRHLRHAFEHYLHPSVIASVVDNAAGLKLGGDRRRLSILFADIVNFTRLSERTDPEKLVSLLTDYMTRMTDVILESGGVVDKIRGDGIMAFWGAPIDVANHARMAIDAAIVMLTELNRLRDTDTRFADFDIGLGIATGEAIVGNFGGKRRFDYSVIGDTVNLASRLETLTRQLKVHLLVSRQTFTEAAGNYVAREIGFVKVKGKEQLVDVIEVVGKADSVDPSFYRRFSGAIDLLRRGEADDAQRQLCALAAEHPEDEVVKMCVEKLEACQDRKPTEMIFEFLSK